MSLVLQWLNRRPELAPRRPVTIAAPSRVAAVLVIVLPVLAACAAIRNTPAQELAEARWQACEEPRVKLRHLELDGRIAFWYLGPSGRLSVLECLAEAARDGRALPEPLTFPMPRGP